jgi:hypothetical protein
MTFHFANLKSEFEQNRKEYEDFAKKNGKEHSLKSELECFAYSLNKRLSRESAHLIKSAFHRHERLVEIEEHIFATPLGVDRDAPLAKKEGILLERLLQYELDHKDLKKWSLSEGGIEDLTLDFNSFSDYLFGPHTDSLDDHLDTFGSFFLSSDQITEYMTVTKEDAEKGREWLREHAGPLLGPMWYFVVSLCRLLQSDENPLNATDAYWLGMVDEVIGERLPSIRLIAENPDPIGLFSESTLQPDQ